MTRAERRRTVSLWADLGLGLVSGLVLPVPLIVLLDGGLLVLGLWYAFGNVTSLGASTGQSVWAALAIALGANLLNLLRHIWAIRGVLVASGGLGALAALAQRASWRIPWAWGRGLSYLVIAAVISLLTSAVILLGVETQAERVAGDRVVYLLRNLGGESYEVGLIVSAAAALIIGLLYWEAWRTLCGGLASRVGLPWSPQPQPVAPPKAPVSEPTVGEYTARLVALRREALPGTARAPTGIRPAQEPTGGEERARQFDLRGAAWLGGALLLCVVAWLPLHSGYGRHVPRAISQSVYLQSGVPEHVERIVLGPSPHRIVFASAVGHGLFDAELWSNGRASALLRELRDFRLKEVPTREYAYARFSLEGLEPGDYVLRMSLRPAGELPPDAPAVMGDGQGVVNYALHQGGGTSYRFFAAGMAVVFTIALLSAVALLVQGVAAVRAR
jgi:hypothetical protein